MRLIDADNALELFQAEYQNTENLIKQGEKQLDSLAEGYTEAAHIIKYISPTVDAVPVVHGRWENGNPICPVCGKDKFRGLDADIWCDWLPDFCPNCGARMDGRGQR